MNRISKVILSIILMALIIWLAVSPITKRSRIAAINESLSKSNPLTDSSSRVMFDTFVKHITSVAGINQNDIRINSPSISVDGFEQKLNFIVSSPAIEKWTNCSRGNAVYDASLNSIFIDVTLVIPSQWYAFQEGFQLGPSDLPFVKTYLQIVLLHELGHYTLHRSSGGYFDGASKQTSKYRKREAEADQFATKTFISYIEKYDDLPEIGNLIDIPSTGLSKRDKSIAALVEMGFANILGMMFGMSTYSPYYHDDAHPTYVERTGTLLTEIISLPDINDEVRVRANEVLNYIEQIRQIAKSEAFVEITFDERVQDMGFSKDFLFVVPARAQNKYGAFYKVERSELKSSISHSLRSIHFDSVGVNNVPEQIMDADERSKIFSFVKENRTFYHERNAGFFEITDRHLVPVKEWDSFADADLYIPPSPFNKFLAITDDELLLVSPASIEKKGINDLKKLIQSELKGKQVIISLNDPLVNGQTFSITLTDTTSRSPTGIAIFDLNSLNLISVKTFVVPDDMFVTSFEKNKNAYFFNSDTGDLFLTTVGIKNSIEVDWSLWKLREDRSPLLVGTYDFLTKQIVDSGKRPSSLVSMYRDRITNCGKNKFLMNWDNDCIFLIDIGRQTVERVFYPGLETMKIRSSDSGEVVIFQPGGYRFYKINI